MSTEALTFGSFYFSSPTATANATATPIKCAGATTAGSLNGFTHTSGNRLTYTGQATRTFEVISAFSMSASAACSILFYFYKNGVLVPGAISARKVSNNDVGSAGLGGLVSLGTNDYLELWCETDGGEDVTVAYGGMIVKVVG